MSRDTDFWQKRYTQQVRWTWATRRYIFDSIQAQPSQNILEVGCGSGAVLDSLAKDGYANTYGLDLHLKALHLVASQPAINADALHLPFSDSTFDICLCHFLLLWVADPLKALMEMKRTAKPGGWVLALAEPDYGGRIDYPPELVALGNAQTQALQSQCADMIVGRKLKSLFANCGLANIHSGIISADWFGDFNQSDFELEWAVLRKDLIWKFSPEEMDRYYHIDLDASRQGRRVLFVPIFYAFGQVAE